MSTVFDNDEAARYEAAVQAFLAGEYDAERFMALRLQHGVYGQRQEGVQMVRVKIPGGVLNAEQLLAI
ncbi:MAG: hypothetical protein GXP10_11410, partial [Gammaproteobacteria bacterium]|nr:hypothetical protein [Gammaproteobacteria bacterium]